MAIVEIDLTPEEYEGCYFITAKDPHLSGWGHAKGGSFVAIPIKVNDAASEHRVMANLEHERYQYINSQPNFKYVLKWARSKRSDQHVHIYDLNSYRY